MATVEFLEGWRQAVGQRYLLARIDIPRLDVVQTDTLYVAESEVGSYPDTIAGGFGKLWQSVVKLFEDVRMPGAYGSTDVPLGASGLQLLADRMVTFPAGVGAEIQSTLRASMATHLWDSARVTFYRYIHELGDFQHAQQFFRGDVIEVGLDGPLLMLKLQQRVDWNAPISLESVNRQKHPRAPEDAVGLPLQVLYGQLQARPLRAPWALGTDVRNRYSMIALGNSRVNPALMVDKGRGGQAANNLKSVVLCAGHPVKSVAAYADRTAIWHDSTEGLCVLDDSQIELLNDATGAGVKLPESGSYAWVRLLPNGIVNQANECENARALFEPNDLSYALFDYGANRRNLSLQFPRAPDISEGGTLTRLIIGYQSSADLAGFKVKAGAGYFASYIYNPLPVRTAPDILLASVPLISGTIPADTGQIDFLFEGTPAGSVKIFFACIAVNFRPKQDVIMSSERRIISTEASMPDRRGGGARTRYRPFQVPVLTPPYTELRGKFFGNQQGYKDDGSGTYTGTANALIERMPDIARHLLTTAGGQDATELDAASFNAARALLVDQLGAALPHGLVLAEQVNVGQMLDSLCSDALAQVRVSPYDDKLKLHVWRRGQTTSYPWKFSRYDILEPQGPNCSRLPVSQIVTGVRVAYDYDQRERTSRSEATLAYNKSVAGYEYRNLRDEYMSVVTGVNDRLNWTRGGAAKTCTLAAADYDPGPLAAEVITKMKAADGAGTINYWCAHGGTVTAECRAITFSILSVGYVVNIAIGTWSMEQLAVQAAVAMNSVGPGGFSVSYSRTTRKFTIANGTSFSLRWCNGLTGEVPNRANALLGYATDATGTVLTGQFEVEEGRFAIVAGVLNTAVNAPIDLNFKSGPDGSDSAVSVRHCADVLGFDPSEDKLVVFNALGAWAGDCPKGTRERNMRAVADRFKDGLLRGARRELAYQARTIYTTRTARALRNRIADLFARPEPPVVARMTTYHAPDIDFGDVFEFQADMDELAACPVLGSGGSWVGQKFVVVEYTHRNGPISRATEVVGVEV